MSEIINGVKTIKFEIEGLKTIFYLRESIGWMQQLEYAPEAHAVFRMSDRAFRGASAVKSYDGMMDVVESRLAKLSIWVVSWTGVDKPTREDYGNLHPAVASRLFQKIEELEEQLEVLPEDSPF